MRQYSASHYPCSGIQHTRAIMALTAAHACFHILTPPESIAKDIEKVMALTDECAKMTRKRKMSRGTERALERANERLAPYIDRLVEADGRRKFNLWSALIFCALTLIEDVICTCPQYADHPPITTWKEFHADPSIKDKWCLLEKEVSIFADQLIELAPNSDMAGTAIYEEVFDALEEKDQPSLVWTTAMKEIKALELAA